MKRVTQGRTLSVSYETPEGRLRGSLPRILLSGSTDISSLGFSGRHQKEVTMRRTLTIACLVLAFLASTSSTSFAGQFTVTRVYDGDTIKAQGHDIEIKVRLVGVDTPETSKRKRDPGQPYSQEAKKYLAGLILNKVIDIKGYGLDGYNRILGVIYLDGKNINLEMVSAGFAEVYRGKPPRRLDLNPLWKAEKEAKAAKKGMWSLGDKYISPKDWRKSQKGN
jgi:endonuclease YncB( thermonuclease family)